jgi:hypothetical protein
MYDTAQQDEIAKYAGLQDNEELKERERRLVAKGTSKQFLREAVDKKRESKSRKRRADEISNSSRDVNSKRRQQVLD